jgi:hypothetical protein
MRFRTLVATCAAVSFSLSALATAASANGVVFDSLDGVTSNAVLTRHSLGDPAHRHVDVAWNQHAVGLGDSDAFIDEIAHDGGDALAIHKTAVGQLCDRRS